MSSHYAFATINADDAAKGLRAMLANDPTIYIVQRSVSQSGMTRHLSVLVMDRTEDGTPYPRNVTAYVAALAGEKYRTDDLSLKVSGVGMDMHFHTGYTLGRRLYGDTDERPRNAGIGSEGNPGYVLRTVTL